MTIYVCKTKDVVQLNQQIYRVRLVPDDVQLLDFKGGQYILLHMVSGETVPLSIASSPEQKKYLELHIRLMHTPSLAEDMINLFKQSKNANSRINIEGAFGDCYLDRGDRDIVVIAGGTGFAPMKSLIESAFAQKNKRQIDLFFGAKNINGLYQNDLIEKWQNTNDNFNYIPVISDGDSSWNGATGFPHQIAIAQYKNKLLKKEIFIGGSEAMVMAVYQALMDEDVSINNIHSDILDIKRDCGEID